MNNISFNKSDPNPNSNFFRPRARIMRTLGSELISSESVALLELVKNSFDADATKVLIRFIEPLDQGTGIIEIIDNGHGMSIKTIQTAWMEPATDNKRKNKKSEILNRIMLGEKGIGRFACSRLTQELELITKRESDNFENYALFDWGQFDNEELYLDEIKVLTEERKPIEICSGGSIDELYKNEIVTTFKSEIHNHGTILRMNKLNKTWSKSEFQDLQRDLSRLISPFSQFSDFQIRLELPMQFSEFSKEVTSPEIIKYPHYSIKGEVTGEGNYKFKLRVYASGLVKDLSGLFLWNDNKKDTDMELLMLSSQQADNLLKSMSKDEFTSKKIQTGPFEIEVRIWDRDDLGNIIQKTNSVIKDVRRDLDAVAGINIYRDGFRVLPYGEPKDDWLRLDIRRVQKPTFHLSNNQIVGFVSISSDNNPLLKDQSNREGLDENHALEDLRQIMVLLLNQVELIRYPLRKRNAQKPTFKPVQGLFNALSLERIREQIATKYPKDSETQQLLTETQQILNNQVDEIQIVIGRYQRLATLGTLIDVILHDGRHPLASIIKQAILGQEEIENNKFENLTQTLQKRFVKIEEQSNILDSTFDKIEPFSGRRRGQPSQLYIEQVIKNAIEVYRYEIKKMGIEISLPQSETLVRIDQAEIQQIILNLLQNSLYWLGFVEKKERKIVIKINRLNEDQIELIFADSGPGVSPEYKDMIFDPYFSTKPNGAGLGLAIIGEIVTDIYNGTLELLDSDILKGAVFRIILNKRGG